jgi:hypothetical protein
LKDFFCFLFFLFSFLSSAPGGGGARKVEGIMAIFHYCCLGIGKGNAEKRREEGKKREGENNTRSQQQQQQLDSGL